jgi:hypothetical protein
LKHEIFFFLMVSPCYCAVCAVRLQFKIFWQGYIKKIRKFMVSPTGIQTDYNQSVFHRELQKNYGIVPQSPTDLPTELPTYNTDGITDRFTHITKRTHVWHVSVCTNTDGITDGFTRIPKRTHVDTCPSARIPTDRKVWRDFWTFFGAHFN